MPICITSKKNGFRRCGIAHPSTRVEYPDGKFTPDQIKILQADPMLVVELVPAGKTLNAADTIALVQAATTGEALDQLANGETRKGVLDAIAKRRIDLTPPPGTASEAASAGAPASAAASSAAGEAAPQGAATAK